MGRSSKFTFPVPGRRNKSTQSNTTSLPMSKAQKILGNGEINVDISNGWDATSNSGMSISVSESSVSYASSRGLGILNEAADQQRDGRVATWEQESDTVPSHLRVNGRRPPTSRKGSDVLGKENVSDLSNIGKPQRESSSSIMSWYDKSRVPLSISQQTSASAMAKGLPSKAGSLLDIRGTRASPDKTKKSSRLDLSHLLPRSRLSIHSSHGTQLGRSSIPPPLPIPLETSENWPLPGKQKSDRKLRKRFTTDALKDLASSIPIRPMTSASHRRGASDQNNLQHLYEHYEKIVLDTDYSEKAFRDIDSASVEKAPSPTQDAPHMEEGVVQVPDTPKVSVEFINCDTPITGKPIISADMDCSASISSRHTRTSKASRRTNQSLFDTDLQHTSVLALSSDSEDDNRGDADVDAATQSSISMPGTGDISHRDGMLASPTEIRRPSTALGLTTKPTKHASFAPSHTYLTVPKEQTGPRQPMLTPRSSSLAYSGVKTYASSLRSSSRLSIMSTSSANSAMTWQGRPGYGILEARQITIRPSQVVNDRSRAADHTIPNDLSTRTSTLPSSNQPTPPHSPSSVDPYVGPATMADPESHPSRFMAVTKQEEMLLAALRLKRARMRESILSELVDFRGSQSQSSLRSQSSRTTLTDADNRSLHQASDRAAQQLTGNVNFNTYSLFPSTPNRPRSVSNGRTSHRRTPSNTDSIPQKQSRRAISERGDSPPGSKQSSLFLFFDQPGDVMDSIEEAEPSPDLSDFMDLDNGSEDETKSEELPFQLPDPVGDELVGTRTGTRENGKHESTRHKSPPSPKTPSSLLDGVRVVEGDGEDEARQPRPDSPISPDGPLGFPLEDGKKKEVRLSAVGRVGMEAGWWGDDG